ncbi:MAG: hypothetical protein NZN45_08095 [Rhodovarius sp.]|nr:hypothetical protein [Rhodovarius sp.]
MTRPTALLRHLPLAALTAGAVVVLLLPFLFLPGSGEVPPARPPAPAPASVADPAAQRLAALEGRLGLLAPVEETRRLAQRLEAAEARLGELGRSGAAAAEAVGSLAARQQLLEGRLAEAAAAQREALAVLERRAEAAERRFTEVEAGMAAAGQRLAGLERRLLRLALRDSLREALAQGRPLGALLPPGAPPALARYAEAAPPTEAELRQGFEDAARAARLATQAAGRGLAGMLTIRRGEELILGDPAEAEIERARRLLSAGDWAGAVQRIAALQGPAREAMNPWLREAEALLAARAALAALGTE